MNQDEYKGILSSAAKLEQALDSTVGALNERVAELEKMLKEQQSRASMFSAAVDNVEAAQQSVVTQVENSATLVNESMALYKVQFDSFLQANTAELNTTIASSVDKLRKDSQEALLSQSNMLDVKLDHQAKCFASLEVRVAEVISKCQSLVDSQSAVTATYVDKATVSLHEHLNLAEDTLSRVKRERFRLLAVICICSMFLGGAITWIVLKAG